MKNRFSSLAASLLALLLAGCVILPFEALLPLAGTAYNSYVVWKSGEATKYYPYDLEGTYQAVVQTANRLNLEPKVVRSNPPVRYSLETRGSVPMEIDVSPHEKDLTKVVIKVSPFGDKYYVELFYRLVDDRLARKTASAK